MHKHQTKSAGTADTHYYATKAQGPAGGGRHQTPTAAKTCPPRPPHRFLPDAAGCPPPAHAAPASPRLLPGRCAQQLRAAGALLCPLHRRAAGRAVAAPLHSGWVLTPPIAETRVWPQTRHLGLLPSSPRGRFVCAGRPQMSVLRC